jgi:hypothetical protein
MPAALDYDTLLPEIRGLHYKINTSNSKATKEDKKKLRKRLGLFFDRCVKVRVRRASNEQKPWTDAEIGLECLRMETKLESGHEQVGDYQFEISINGGPWRNLGLCIERKSVPDAHQTLLFQMDRFTDELKRYYDTDYLYQFRVIIEGSLEDFLTYCHPVPNNCKFCSYCQLYRNKNTCEERYACTYDFQAKQAEAPKVVRHNYWCRHYIQKVKTKKELEDLKNWKLSLIEALEAEQFSVSFYGNRKLAAGAVKTIVKRFFVAHYVLIFDL